MIINADDFGYDGETNRAVLDSFTGGYCSSATLLANMPGFDEACQMIHDHRLGDRIGVHLVMTEGVPLTDGMRRRSRFCDKDGRFCLSRTERVVRMSPIDRVLLKDELVAQVRRCRQHEIPITHADSHRHAHEEWAIASVVMEVCREEGIPYLRLARNCGPSRTMGRRAYRLALNCRLRRAGLARTRYFGSAVDYAHLLRTRGVTEATKSAEVMMHPVYDSAGNLIDKTNGSGVRLAELSKWFSEAGEPESYSSVGLREVS